MCKMKEFARQICWGKRGEKSGKRKKKKEKIGEKRKIFHRMIFSGTVVVVSITHHFLHATCYMELFFPAQTTTGEARCL